MRVILIADVDSVGMMGEIKEVKAGMARNFLIPQKLAIRATPGNIKVWEQKSKILEKREEGLKAEAQGFASKLDGASVTIEVKVGDEAKMFGSVTSQNIADALAEIGHEVSRKAIELSSPIKELGTYDLGVKLFQDVVANITVTVIGENGETAPIKEAKEESAELVEEVAEEAQAEETTEEVPEEAASEDETDSEPEGTETEVSEESEETAEEEPKEE